MSISRDRFIKGAALAFTAQMLLTSVHHAYGGLTYDSALRLAMPVFAVVELLIVLGLLYWYRQSGARIALGLFCTVTVLVGVVQGLFHTLYGHLYKDFLFIAGVTSENVRQYFFPVLPNDFIYPPDDFFFEATGGLELVTISLIAIFMFQLIRDWRAAKESVD